MAMADYYLCDVCGEKCFYDANLNWGYSDGPNVKGQFASLDRCGDMKAICIPCSGTHEVIVRPIADEITDKGIANPQGEKP